MVWTLIALQFISNLRLDHILLYRWGYEDIYYKLAGKLK